MPGMMQNQIKVCTQRFGTAPPRRQLRVKFIDRTYTSKTPKREILCFLGTQNH